MAEILAVGGIIVQAVVWRLVADGRLPFWPATAVTFAALGFGALLVVDHACCLATTGPLAAALGAGSGLLLYAVTRGVVGLATRLPAFREAVAGVYGRSDETALATALVVSVVVAAPGEELFWRGLVLSEVRADTAPLVGAVLAWLGYVGVNAAWVSLPLLAGAVVGGAAWTALGVWSHGVVAPVASHVVWTGLMLAWPPSAARVKVDP
jgi:membrane protease YdiL (CAAX protease family)